MKNLIYYIPRALSILIAAFFAIFILEGFGPDFHWQDSASHLVLTLIAAIPAITTFKHPKIGGWLFIALGAAFAFFFSGNILNTIIISGVPILTGIMFLIEKPEK